MRETVRNVLDFHSGEAMPASTRARTRGIVSELARKSKENGAEQLAAVATSAFRDAENGRRVACEVGTAAGVSIWTISQPVEASLGFRAAVQGLNVAPEQAVVWDVGGGSMEMSSVEPTGQFVTYSGRFSSKAMRWWLAGSKVASPNPVTREKADAGLEHAAAIARDTVPVQLKAKLSKEAVVIGIGAIKYHARKQPRRNNLNNMCLLCI